ncbi:MAG TPA: ATP-binding protein [Gemmataceae bacterium]|nr:ATP-binding protein [Gemmataceae bacterium]
MSVRLIPSQQRAYDELQRLLPLGNVFVLAGDEGVGRTTVLRQLHHEVGGAFLNMKDFTSALRQGDPAALEETFEQIVLQALEARDTVIVDDLRLLSAVTSHHFYPRYGLLEAPLTTLTSFAADAGKKLVFAAVQEPSRPIKERCHFARIREFDAGDYEALCSHYLGHDRAGRLDYRRIYRFARELNAHQLKAACQSHDDRGDLDTERFIDYLRSNRLFSNVDLGEVQSVELRDLHGVDDVIRSLEANIVVPLENDKLASELCLKPKRGVLLAGPPGTGKTTIGRALAHRLKGKFFLLDGTFISGSCNFFERVHDLFEKAKQSAPSILFIDDSDMLFENHDVQSAGLYRYLLTLLDGLESETAGRVCVMMTVMDVATLPPALVRSGRVELWLQMRLPDEATRTVILGRHLAGLPKTIGAVDAGLLARETDSFTGADLKRLVEDGKALLAYDRARGLQLRPATEYFAEAVQTVRANKQAYAEANGRCRSNDSPSAALAAMMQGTRPRRSPR